MKSWARIRVLGRSGFVAISSVAFFVLSFISSIFTNYVFGDPIRPVRALIASAVVSGVMSFAWLFVWKKTEREYTQAGAEA
jgi:membrane associated rhomboid family serine protease